MCGIVGIISKNGKKISTSTLQHMCNLLHHRGPDEEGFYMTSTVGFGHKRLSIIDLSTGKQPISNEDSTIWIVFNGEIYNYQTLRKQLIDNGHKFKTKTDTETILHLYEQEGENFVTFLRGMFAIAIWDQNQKKLILVRDRLGIKPLYYADSKDYFFFSSEPKSLMQNIDIDLEIDYTAIDDYFTLLYIPSPKTIFKSIKKLEPGTILVWEGGKYKLNYYWDISFANQYDLSVTEWAEKLISKWEETITVHLISDVPLGAFLSGGLDSSSVVATMCKLCSKPVSTFSIAFKEKGYDESEDAQIVAKLFKTNHHSFTVTPKATQILNKLLWHYDEPFADSSSICLYYLSEMASKYVKVVLSGDGGDENFGGYRRYVIDKLENKIRQLIPNFLRRTLIHWLAEFYPQIDTLPTPLRLKTFLTNLSQSHYWAYYNSISILREKEKKRLYKNTFINLLNEYTPFLHIKNFFDKADSENPLAKILYVDIKTYLPDDYLVKVDRAGMAHSLEVRPPFVDHEFMELTAKIPSHLKINRTKDKYLWRKIMKGILPKHTIIKKKKGFDVPIGNWFKTQLRNSFTRYVLGKDSVISNYLNPVELERLFTLHLKGLRNFSHLLWAIFILEIWFRIYMNKEELPKFDPS